MRALKKSISVILALILVFSAASTAAFAASPTPVIYLRGDQKIYYTNENGEKVGLFDDGEYLSAFASTALPLIPKALLSGNWDDYADAALDVLLPAFEKVAPSPDGTLPEGTGINWSWSASSLRPSEYWAGGRPVYIYEPDSRLSPLDIADDINDFIETVRSKTGSQKVIIVSRCEGGCLAAAYLYEYAWPDDFSKIENVIFLNSSVKGAGYAEALLTGNVVIPAEAAYRFVQYMEHEDHVREFIESGTLDQQLLGYIYMVIEMLRETYGLEITAELVELLYRNLKDNFFAKLLKSWWGICGSYVACVYDNYEDYVPYVFQEEGDAEKYSAIISKMDEYHYSVQVNLDEMLLAAKAAGVGVNAIVEYGAQVYPVSDDSELIGDTFLNAKRQSFGATTSKTVGALSDSYIKSRVKDGYGDYISPDKQIDASTSLLPDNVWYIKNLIHDWPPAVTRLMESIIADPSSSVKTTSYSQFMNYNSDGTLSVLQEVNDNDYVWETEIYRQGNKNNRSAYH